MKLAWQNSLGPSNDSAQWRDSNSLLSIIAALASRVVVRSEPAALIATYRRTSSV